MSDIAIIEIKKKQLINHSNMNLLDLKIQTIEKTLQDFDRLHQEQSIIIQQIILQQNIQLQKNIEDFKKINKRFDRKNTLNIMKK